MLWLSGLMGLMAVGMFTLLWFLPVRRTAETEAFEDHPDAAPPLFLLPEPAETSTVTETDERAVTQDDDPQDSDLQEDIDETDLAEPDFAAPEEASAEDTMALDEEAADEMAESEEAVPDWLAALAASSPDEDADLDADTTTQSRDEEAESVAADPETDADMDEWFLAGAGTADFEDFDPEEDDLVVIWDDAQGDVPSVEVVRNDEDPAIARVLMGDVILAEFRTRADIRYDEISLVPLSTARSLGWAQI